LKSPEWFCQRAGGHGEFQRGFQIAPVSNPWIRPAAAVAAADPSTTRTL
jgi:hypothetical protein